MPVNQNFQPLKIPFLNVCVRMNCLKINYSYLNILYINAKHNEHNPSEILVFMHSLN